MGSAPQIFRDLTPHDAVATHAMQCRSYEAQICEDVSLFAKMLHDPRTVKMAICDTTDTLMGYVFAYPATVGRVDFYDGPNGCQDMQQFYLHELTLDPIYQGRGLGAALYNALEDRLKTCGTSKILANAIEGRLAFWQKMGFDAVTAADYHGMPSTRIEKIITKKDQDL